MANRRQIKRSIKQLQSVKTWQLVILLFIMVFIASTFLRLDNIGMAERRDAVLTADKSGDQNEIKSRLYELQRYVSAHMNTDMGSIYLENQYKLATQEALGATANGDNPNGNIYKKAQDVCAPRFTHYSQAYLQCTVDYLSQYGPADDPTSLAKLPKANAYRYSYASPVWSPDFAGFSVLLCLLIVVVIVGRLLSLMLLKAMLKMRNRGA